MVSPLLREQSVLVPVVFVFAIVAGIIGVTMAAVGRGQFSYAWFAPIVILFVSYGVYNLYEKWGI